MRRFEASLVLPEPFEEEDGNDLAEVIQLPTRPDSAQTFQRELKAVGSDVEPGDSTVVRSGLGRPLVGIHIPNALNKLPKADPKGEIPEEKPEQDLTHLAELLEFVLWLVGEGVTEVAELGMYICYQFEIGTYSDREIASVLEVILSET